MAEFNWKQLAGSVAISGIEKFKNSGSKAQVSNLVADLIENLKVSFQNEINVQMFSDGTGNGSKDIGGLALLVEEGTAWSTVGGISSNTYSFWRNQWTGAIGSFGGAGEGAMLTMWNNCARQVGKIKPDLIITDQSTYESYHNAGVRLQRVVSSDKGMLDLGFPNLEFLGTPLTWDSDCTAGYMYFLSSSCFNWNVGKGFDLKSTPFVRPDDQDAESMLVLLYCNLSTGNRRRNGVLTAITNP